MTIPHKATKRLALIVFCFYMYAVLKLTVFRPGYMQRQINLLLFVDLLEVYRYAGMRPFLRLFLGNIGWFVPFGFLLPYLSKTKSALRVVTAGALFSFGIEAAQFVFAKGVTELDDLLLNTLGVAIGYCLYRVCARILSIP